MRVALVNTKGGVGKTTSAAYLAVGLARQGPTLLVDGDPAQSLRTWAALAGDGFPPTEPLATRDLDRRLPELAAGYRHVVIDTAPGRADIAAAAVRAAGLVVIPAAPTLLDLDRLRPTLELLAAAQRTLAVRVLLTRVRARTIAGRVARAWLQARGLPLLEQQVALRESYAASFGLVPVDLGEYQAVLAELAEVGVAR
jgi:chromosome partitioning protein